MGSARQLDWAMPACLALNCFRANVHMVHWQTETKLHNRHLE